MSAINFFSKIYRRYSIRYKLDQMTLDLKRIQTKMTMEDDIWGIPNAKFYLPHYPIDLIAREIVDNNNFYEIDILKELDAYVPKDACICDIGANIGNHTLYWYTVRKAKKIYAFEPVKKTFDILKRNIEINDCGGVLPYNIGLSDEDGSAEIMTFRADNLGATHIKKDKDGLMRLRTLDSYKIPEKIDFIKIDVEGFEHYVLKGAKETIARCHPFVFIETYPDHFNEVHSQLKSYGYDILREFPHYNYLYGKA